MKWIVCVAPLLLVACSSSDGEPVAGEDGSNQSSCAATCAGCCSVDGACLGGAADNACGTGGASCADCAQSASRCAAGRCEACAPSCAGIPCGGSDGCGGLCTPGSGCAEPQCAGEGCQEPSASLRRCVGDVAACQPAARCDVAADIHTLLLYRFGGTSSQIKDEAGAHHGKLVGNATTRGKSIVGCHPALQFKATSTPSYLEVPNGADWQLKSGSIDFWVRFDKGTETAAQGIVSRDAKGTDKPGHLSLFRTCEGVLLLRLQRPEGMTFQCSAPTQLGKWYRVGINFGAGGLQLYVDGKRATRTTKLVCGTNEHACGGSSSGGIAGNENPWVVGASAGTSAEGLATPVTNQLVGAIDNLRISKQRRKY